MIDVLGGRVDLGFFPVLTALPHIKSGKLKVLGVTGKTRMPANPDWPAIAEFVPGYEVKTWFGILVPAKTPKAIIAKLNSEVQKILKSPDIVERFSGQGFDLLGGSPEEFAAHIRAEITKMFSSNDWSKTEELIRTGEAAGITPMVRIQSNPWHGYDPRLAVDVTRALGVGAQFVTVSVSSKREVEECMEAGKDWHRKVMIIHWYKDYDDWVPKHAEQSKESFVMPLLESEGAINEMNDIIKMPDMKILRIAMTDSSRVLTGGHKPDWYHPALWKRLDAAVALAKQHDMVVGANTSYAYSLEELQNRIRRLHEHGVRMILVQGANFLFQVAMDDFLRPLRSILRLRNTSF